MAALAFALGTTATPDVRAASAAPIHSLESSLRVQPTRAGTPAIARPVAIDGWLAWTHRDAPPPSHLNLYTSRRLAYVLDERPTCPVRPLRASDAAACPPGSFVGSARAGGNPPFNAFCTSSIQLINAGARRIYVAASGGCGMVVDQVTVGRVTPLASPKWGYRITLPLPQIFLHSTPSSDGAFLFYSLGERPRRLDEYPAEETPRTSGYWRATGCPPSGRHAIRAEIPHSGASPAVGASATRATARCQPSSRARANARPRVTRR